MFYKIFTKRLIDIIISLICLIILTPILIIVTLNLLIANKGKVFFVQKRPGRNEHIFMILKFKTMNDKRDKDNNLLSDAERLTKIGKLIRKTSLDEIPQLINVLKGDMSLIGPRPLLIEYLPLYNEKQKRRHSVKPGITGLAQVNGRNAISWEQKFEYDVEYIDQLSFWGDMKILLLTVMKVFKSEGISQNGEATMQPFKGTKYL